MLLKDNKSQMDKLTEHQGIEYDLMVYEEHDKKLEELNRKGFRTEYLQYENSLYYTGSVMKNVKNNKQIRIRTFIDDKYSLQHKILEI
tara:strand:+ start:1831 stop:2094 length:264 start_codon:yes stop_codon:yes gene_type:complete